MEKSKKMPIMVNDYLVWRLPLAAKQFVAEFTGGVYPILHRFKILDDAHIQKYLFSLSREDIYNDVLKSDPEVIKDLEQDALFEPERDIWGIFRDGTSPVKTPQEEGFVFAKMPFADYSNRNTICKALSVRNKEIFIDEKYLLDVCIVHPTEQQKELWALLSDFCEKFNEAGYYKKWLVNHLFNQQGGKVVPSINIILGRYNISRYNAIKKNKI